MGNGVLDVVKVISDDFKNDESIVSLTANRMISKWIQVIIDVNIETGNNIEFIARSGHSSYVANIAIDNIVIFDKPCEQLLADIE
ncbi:hypothetical protein A3Q56_07127 [Intoshia linei]|uniref:Uncharacterized protein n=1 Tax=Intoshia linei TaxID=1819745 RepID=A0A177AT08_9BILA|nr:hypothetical protein A3Q56_07127 [Intoshia linei]